MKRYRPSRIGRAWRGVMGPLQASYPKRVLVLGDSHVRVFEHAWFTFTLPRVRFEIEYVPGATAIGIDNRQSVTDALNRFTEALEASVHDWVLVNLGEVDTAYSLWRLAELRRHSIEALTDMAVDHYCGFLAAVSGNHRVAVLSAPLPTLADQAAPRDETAAVRQHVGASQRERTELALAFNARIKSFCAAHGLPYLDSSREAQDPDGLVKRSWLKRSGFDHHYARWPYARCLARQLRTLFAQAVTA